MEELASLDLNGSGFLCQGGVASTGGTRLSGAELLSLLGSRLLKDASKESLSGGVSE